MKSHKKLYKIICSVQNVKNGLILAKSPTYSPNFFFQNWHIPDKNIQSKHVI